MRVSESRHTRNFLDGEPDKHTGAVSKTDGARKGVACKWSAILHLTP